MSHDDLKLASTTAAAWSDFRRVWPQLLMADVAYKLLGFVLLTPLFGLALRLGVSLSGGSVLADQDILFFLLRPVGLTVMAVIAALALALVALEQAYLMTIGLAAAAKVHVGIATALRFSLTRWRPVIALTLRLIVRCLALALPFVAGVGVVYLALLTDYDINFYLTERPPAFTTALVLAALLVAGLAVLLVPRLIGWSLALPLLLFEGVAPSTALAESRRRVEGHRPPIAAILVLWGGASFLLSVILPSLVLGLGRAIGPLGRSRVEIVLALMLALVALWLLTNLLVSWLSSSAFALLVVQLYDRFGGGRAAIRDWLTAGQQLEGTRALRVSLRGVLAGLCALAIVTGVIGYFLLDGIRDDDDVVIIAHRGASLAAPENTMAAVEEALAQGTDYVEIDVQETADGEVAVFHDSDFMKVSGLGLNIWDATRTDLARLDIGSWFDPGFADQRVPTLQQVLEAARGKAKVNIELKYYGHDERLEERVVEIVEAAGMTDEIVAMSLKYDAVQKLHALRPDWRVGLLTATAIGDLTTLEADFLAVNAQMATRGFVRRAHQRGKDVYVWTINDPVQMFRMMNVGVDGIITDEPGLARWVIERRSELNAAERLLVGIAFFFGAAAPDPPASVDVGAAESP